MSDIRVWSEVEHQLWQRLSAHPFDQLNGKLDFVAKLAREHGWNRSQARQAIEEYRRFCFLAVVAGHPVTPGGDVDEVWHLHLTHSHDYWKVFCPSVLGTDLHHEPTAGGPSEAQRHYLQYAQTLRSYQDYFGAPPERYWPAAATQFHNPARYRRVDLSRVHLLPRLPAPLQWQNWRVPAALALLVIAPQVIAQTGDPLDWSGPAFLKLFTILLIVATLVGMILRRRLRDTGAQPSTNLTATSIAYLAGGVERVVDTAIAELLALKAIKWSAQLRRLRARKNRTQVLEFPLDLVEKELHGHGDVRLIARVLQPKLDPVRVPLEQRGLLLTRQQAWRIRLLSAAPVAAVVAFGVMKISIGIGRGRPVGFLVALAIVGAIVTLNLLFRATQRSVAGDRTIAKLTQDKAHATRAPLDSDVGLAVALAGTAVLSGTAYAAYHDSRMPVSSSYSGSSDSSSGCSSSDSGGSSCSSGCGGCGGGGD